MFWYLLYFSLELPSPKKYGKMFSEKEEKDQEISIRNVVIIKCNLFMKLISKKDHLHVTEKMRTLLQLAKIGWH